MEAQNVISTLEELTRQRDLLTLRARLLGVLIELTEARWLVLCRMVESGGRPQMEVLDRVPNPSPGKADEPYASEVIECVELFAGCRAAGEPVWVTGPSPYEAQIFRVPAHEQSDDFIVLFDHRVTRRTERIVSGILKLYENFMTLVVESTQDPLTRLYNRQAFDRDLGQFPLRQRHGRRSGDAPQLRFLAMFDIDHFKRINDGFAHLYGDEVLLLFAGLLQQTFRDGDRIYRYGGEEFAVILCNLDAAGAAASLERCRRSVESHAFPQVGQVTVSIGFTEMSPHIAPSTLIEQADRALYHSKDAGRNRVTYFEEIAGAGSAAPEGSGVELF